MFLHLARQLRAYRVHVRGRSGPVPIDEWPG
jgi:hypothetical protein